MSILKIEFFLSGGKGKGERGKQEERGKEGWGEAVFAKNRSVKHKTREEEGFWTRRKDIEEGWARGGLESKITKNIYNSKVLGLKSAIKSVKTKKSGGKIWWNEKIAVILQRKSGEEPLKSESEMTP